MPIRLIVAALVIVIPAFSQVWSAQSAAQYLDSRQQAWSAWPNAMQSGVPCVSCHTGLPYLVARPALRQALHQGDGPTLYERLLADSMRATVLRTDAKDLFSGLKGPIVDQVYGAQSVLSALVLAMDDQLSGRLSPEAEKSFERLWALQVKTGTDKGTWQWSDFDLDPWETKDSAFYGAALAALATGVAPGQYQHRPAIHQNIADMTAYLRAGQSTQPLHNRLFLLWASSRLDGLLTNADKEAIMDEIWRKQASDGGWTLESLGHWTKRANAPPENGSNSYATALVAFTVQQSGVESSSKGLSQALSWLRTHQNPDSGSWFADSMNHKHDPDSMPAHFMSDAATGYGAAALLLSEQRTTRDATPRTLTGTR